MRVIIVNYIIAITGLNLIGYVWFLENVGKRKLKEKIKGKESNIQIFFCLVIRILKGGKRNLFYIFSFS